MRRWCVPVTVLGVAGLGALVFTQRGRQALAWLDENFAKAPEALREWNETFQREVEQLQAALDQVADSLQTAR